MMNFNLFTQRYKDNSEYNFEFKDKISTFILLSY